MIIFLLLIVLLLLGVLLYRSLHAEQRLQHLESRLQQGIRDEVGGLFNQLESYHYLRDRLNLQQGMPYTRDWSAAPDFLKLIVEHCLEHKPRTIVECSSGLTTVMLARCCEMNGGGEVSSLENGAEFATKTRKHLARYRLQTYASVIDAPLQTYTLNATPYEWYAIDELPDHSIEMLVIDGPPGFIQRHSRYPALPLLFNKLADGCVIFMDDAARDDEKAIVAMWQAEFTAVEHRFIHTERGCSLLRVER